MSGTTPGLSVSRIGDQIMVAESGVPVLVLPVPVAAGLAGGLLDEAAASLPADAVLLRRHLEGLADDAHEAMRGWDARIMPSPGQWMPSPWRSPRQWPTVPHGVTARCDGTSVGVLVEIDGRFPVFLRRRPPLWLALPAGHIDAHGSPERAAAAELREEIGLTAGRLDLVWGPRWVSNPCRRHHSGWGPGHEWRLYRAGDVTGTAVGAADEVDGLRWVTRDELQGLADRTVEVARLARGVTQADALEPVWVLMLAWTGVVDLTPGAVADVIGLVHADPHPGPVEGPGGAR